MDTILQYIAWIAAFGSFIVATITVLVIRHGNYTSRISSNAWEVYKLYNSEEIKRARITTRTLIEDPDWKKVIDYPSYRAYFQLDTPAGQGQEKEHKKQQELEVHNFLAFYHQVGLLLEHKLLRKDFTMLLLGGGLDDRWEFLKKIPQFYPNHPYTGMYELHKMYCKWTKRHVPVESLASPSRTPSRNLELHHQQGAAA